MAVGIRHADHVAPSIRKSWHQLRRQAEVARSVQFARGLRPRSLVLSWHMSCGFHKHPQSGELIFELR
jgi:hypothetical protein